MDKDGREGNILLCLLLTLFQHSTYMLCILDLLAHYIFLFLYEHSITIKCRDFIQIYPGYAGPVGQSYTLPFVSDECDELEDECGSTLDIDNLLATNQYYVLFRVGKENEEGERFVRNPGTDEYYKGFQIYSICVRAYYYGK